MAHARPLQARVLVVESQDALRDALRDVLELSGCRVREAGSRLQALQSLAEDPVEVVVADVLLAERAGLDLIADIRRDKLAGRIVAVAAGAGGTPALEAARRAGADHCLALPFSAQELIAAVAG